MTSSKQRPPSKAAEPVDTILGANPLSVSKYEMASAALVTALILFGTALLLMVAVWLTSRVWVKQTALAPQLIEPLPGGGGDGGDSREYAEPAEQEEFETPEPDLQESLDAITDLVTPETTQLSNTDSTANFGHGGGGGSGGMGGPGTGRQLPRWDRWEIRYDSSSLANYAKQLDFFKIELAALGGGRKQIDYASNLSAANPRKRTGTNDDRIYMTWRSGPLAVADAQLLAKAKIPTDGRITVQFLPLEIENQLAVLEDAALKKRSIPLEKVAKTTFGVVSEKGGYTFTVLDVKRR